MKYFLIISIYVLFYSLNGYAGYLNITIDYEKDVNCKLEKQILKNEIYDYKEFSADQIKDNKEKK